MRKSFFIIFSFFFIHCTTGEPTIVPVDNRTFREKLLGTWYEYVIGFRDAYGSGSSNENLIISINDSIIAFQSRERLTDSFFNYDTFNYALNNDTLVLFSPFDSLPFRMGTLSISSDSILIWDYKSELNIARSLILFPAMAMFGFSKFYQDSSAILPTTWPTKATQGIPWIFWCPSIDSLYGSWLAKITRWNAISGYATYYQAYYFKYPVNTVYHAEYVTGAPPPTCTLGMTVILDFNNNKKSPNVFTICRDTLKHSLESWKILKLTNDSMVLSPLPQLLDTDIYVRPTQTFVLDSSWKNQLP